MTTAPLSGGETRRAVLLDLAVGVPVVLLVAAATWRLLDLPATYVVQVLGLYTAASFVLLWTRPDDFPGSGLGPANRVTLGRLALLLPLAALPLSAQGIGTVGRWWVIGIGTAIMMLDGVDGRVARRTGSESAFGARFDMETDAFLMLILSVLVWTEGLVGAWVILIGAMRYLFVAASWAVRALRAELFPSLRRKVVCVVQGIALLVCLGPIIPAPLAVIAAAIALLMSSWSFGVDTVWLLRRGQAG